MQRVDTKPIAAGVVNLLMGGKRPDVLLEGGTVGIQLLMHATRQPHVQLAIPAVVDAALPNPAAILI